MLELNALNLGTIQPLGYELLLVRPYFPFRRRGTLWRKIQYFIT
jgi:hypothetical protein